MTTPERPILFSAPMVKAILEGRKTQTRRVVKPQPIEISWFEHQRGWCARVRHDTGSAESPAYVMVRCPYGKEGDRLWVRETWAQAYDMGGGFVTVLPPTSDATKLAMRTAIYRADDPPKNLAATWKPSIFMPRWASRLTLEVTGIRVERVASISEEDCFAEGIEKQNHELMGGTLIPAAFKTLWDSINRERGYGWDSNPWVWVISFRRVG